MPPITLLAVNRTLVGGGNAIVVLNVDAPRHECGAIFVPLAHADKTQPLSRALP